MSTFLFLITSVLSFIWQEATALDEFLQREPDQGANATERTEVRLLVDREAIYFGAWLFDRDPAGIIPGERIRDGVLTNSDYVSIIFDTYRDRQNGFLFATTPAGIEYDAQVVKEGEGGGVLQSGQGRMQSGSMGGLNLNWDASWTVRTSRDSLGWYAEFRIPFSTLRYGGGNLQTWGLNVARSIRRRNEVEADQDEEKTRELTLKKRIKEKPAVKPAKPAAVKEAPAPAPERRLLEDEEEAELDLSDLTLDTDVETTRPAQTVGEDEITEADLENLLQETADEEITFDLSSDEEGEREGKDEEVTDADLEALLQEATAGRIEEAKEEAEVLEIVSEAEAVGEVQLEEEKPALMDIEAVADSFEETQAVTEPLAEEEEPSAVTHGEEGTIELEKPVREEISSEALSVEARAFRRSGSKRSSPRSFRRWSKGLPGRPWPAWLKE